MGKPKWTTDFCVPTGISLPVSLIGKVDKLARKAKVSRSKMLSQLVTEAIAARTPTQADTVAVA